MAMKMNEREKKRQEAENQIAASFYLSSSRQEKKKWLEKPPPRVRAVSPWQQPPEALMSLELGLQHVSSRLRTRSLVGIDPRWKRPASEVPLGSL
mmetsp:Transcript_17745/g.26806  ORF Transcript_17745/g.26806 Transcript_17745/m.26806 type:complete len:95 (-) Transcript_17745:48-332(-)